MEWNMAQVDCEDYSRCVESAALTEPANRTVEHKTASCDNPRARLNVYL